MSQHVGLFVRLHAKPDKAQELADLLQGAVSLAQKESLTLSWYAIRFDEHTFGIFDTFAAEAGRQAHLNGDIAAALMANAERLLSQAPNIEKVQIMAKK